MQIVRRPKNWLADKVEEKKRAGEGRRYTLLGHFVDLGGKLTASGLVNGDQSHVLGDVVGT